MALRSMEIKAELSKQMIPVHRAKRLAVPRFVNPFWLITWPGEEGHVNIVVPLYKKCADIVMQLDYGYAVLHHAVMNCCFEVIDWLLSKNVDVNYASHIGYVPLSPSSRGWLARCCHTTP
jgi:hypothetical protein